MSRVFIQVIWIFFLTFLHSYVILVVKGDGFMGFASRLKEARENKGLTQKELARLAGVRNTAISNYEKGNSFPNVDILYKIFDALQVEPNFFFQDEINYGVNISIDEKQLLDNFRALDNHSQYVVTTVINAEKKRFNAEKINSISNNNIIELPKYRMLYYDMPVSAGTGNPLEDEYPEEIELFQKPPKGTNFIVRITGNSMEPTYKSDDKLFVIEQPDIKVGEIGIFVINGNAYVKELAEDGLISHNENYPKILLDQYSTIKCCGKVIGVCTENFK